MPHQNIQEQAHSLFEYIKEAYQLKHQSVLNIDKQPGSVFVKDLNDPAYVTIFSRASNENNDLDSDLLVRFHKPDFSPCPEPPETLLPWLKSGWHDFHKEASHWDSLPEKSLMADDASSNNASPRDLRSGFSNPAPMVQDPFIQSDPSAANPVSSSSFQFTQEASSISAPTAAAQSLPAEELKQSSGSTSVSSETPKEDNKHFDDDEKRVELFSSWLEKRKEWVKKQQHIEQIINVFTDLFEMYNTQRQYPDTLELMVGNGILTDKQNESIRHPIFLKRISIALEAAKNTLLISDTDEPGEMYMPLFSALDNVNIDLIRSHEKEAQDRFLHPMDKHEGCEFLKAVTHQLTSNSKFLSEKEIDAHYDERIAVRWDPVLFLRKKSDGTPKTLDTILTDLDSGTPIPESLINILGGKSHTEGTFEDTGFSSSDDWENTHELPLEDEEILLPKPANREQMQIVRQIEHSPAVLVQGPPGTGKTHTIANLLGHFLAQGKTVLVTSHTSKALTVLKDKVPKDIQPLCVAVFGDNREDMKQSVNDIIEKTSATNLSTIKKNIDRIRSARHKALLDLQDARNLVYSIRHKEFEPIIYNGDSWSPANAAAYVSEHEYYSGLIPGNIETGSPFPLNDDELVQLYSSNSYISQQEETELSCNLPDIDSILSPEQFSDGLGILERLNNELKKINANGQMLLSWKSNQSAVIDTRLDEVYAQHGDYQAEADLRSMLAIYEEKIPDWAAQAIADGTDTTYSRQKWDELLNQIAATYSMAQKVSGNQVNKPVKLLISDYIILIPSFKELQADALKHGRVKKGIFMKKELKAALDKVTVGAHTPETIDEINQVLDYLMLKHQRENLGYLWDSLLGIHGERPFSDLGNEPEKYCYQQIEHIEFWLDWSKKAMKDLVAQSEKAGIGFSIIQPFNIKAPITEKKASSLIEQIQVHLIPASRLVGLINQLHIFTQKKENTYNILAACHGSVICTKLQSAIETRDLREYQSSIIVLAELRKKEAAVKKRIALLRTIAAAAPSWAASIQNREGVHGLSVVPEGLQEAWKVKQLSMLVDRIISTSLSKAEERVSINLNRYRKETEKLASELAWYALQQRISADHRILQVLNGWKQTISRIGKGTGKRADSYRAEARKLMIECQKAVPAWIMPVSGVMNSIDPSKTNFDVIIIDEASQSDITSAAILYMGKKIIVVGDDEQVSPMSVGIDEDKLQALMNTFIKGKIPNAHLWDAQTSLYDIAAQVYHPLMLREHFRCVPDIIGYSNLLSYHGKIKPLREAGSSPFMTATVPYRVNGIRKGRSKINLEEANAIVALMQACIAQPEYTEKTFGVISMLGDDQAKLINRKLANAIPLQEYEHRQILCGNASDFQGDERDIIFLSLVDSNESDGPLRMESGEGMGSSGKSMKQRYNVAVSRAKDQLWVIHSLDPQADLKSGDMRRRLLEYVANPKAYESIREQVDMASDSPFEAEIATELISKGYHIKQQWRVGSYYLDMVAKYGDKQIAIECDGERWHSGEEKIREDIERQEVLERVGWSFIRIRGSEYYRNKSQTIERVINELSLHGINPENNIFVSTEEKGEDNLLERVKNQAAKLLYEMNDNDNYPPSSPQSIQVSDVSHTNSFSHQSEQISFVDFPIPAAAPESEEPKVSETSPEEQGSQVSESISNVHKSTAPITVSEEQEPQTPEQSQAQVSSQPTSHTEEEAHDDLLMELRNSGFIYFDKRKESGILWVIIDSSKQDLFEALSKRYLFTYTEGAHGALATRGKPAWRVRTMR